MTIEFVGTRNVEEKRYVHYMGYIPSKEFLKHFDPKTWLPIYQRDRVPNKRKIRELISIFAEHKKIDSVKLNLFDGSIDGRSNQHSLKGQLHIIDGQQRIWALTESGIEDYMVPVELYVGLTLEEEAELYSQFNEKNTKLPFADIVLGFLNPLSDRLRAIVKNKKYPVPVSKLTGKGVSFHAMCHIFYWAHHKMKGFVRVPRNSAARLKEFIVAAAASERPQDLDILEATVRQMMNVYVDIFGSYDPDSLAYRRPVFLAFNYIAVTNFLKRDTRLRGVWRLDFGPFESKIYSMPKLLQNARVKEMSSAVSEEAIEGVHDFFIDYLNKNRRTDKLLTVAQLTNKAKGDQIELPPASRPSAQEELDL